jgi:hypothetical protein
MSRRLGLSAAALIAGALLAMLAGPSAAQSGPGSGFDPNRDCQTIRQCRFTPGGAYRGCISAYSCRVCQLVTSRCTISGRGQTCRQMRCTWG